MIEEKGHVTTVGLYIELGGQPHKYFVRGLSVELFNGRFLNIFGSIFLNTWAMYRRFQRQKHKQKLLRMRTFVALTYLPVDIQIESITTESRWSRLFFDKQNMFAS